ncbi:MAG TPA: hypothetical protein VNM43_04100 [Dehalococcoidia bacterium]|nr:hypothetical protein [Dehalococcoidia bacterium]
MREVFAGLVVGYGLAVALSPLAALWLLRAARTNAAIRRAVPERTNPLALTMVVHFFGLYLLTALGIVLGLALRGIEDRRPEGGLGSPNVTYTALVLGLAAAAALPIALLGPRWRAAALAGAAVGAGVFGWLVPWVAELA